MTWYKQYVCSLTPEQQIFLNYFTEKGFTSLIPVGLILSKPTKTTVNEACEIVQHWINTGEWKYTVPEMTTKVVKEHVKLYKEA